MDLDGLDFCDICDTPAYAMRWMDGRTTYDYIQTVSGLTGISW